MQARDWCTTTVTTFPGNALKMHSFSAVRHADSALFFGGVWAPSNTAGKGTRINSVLRVNLATLTHEAIKTLGVHRSRSFCLCVSAFSAVATKGFDQRHATVGA